MTRRLPPERRIWTALLFLLVVAGCGGGSGDYSRYMPNATESRRALEAALQAWQRGEPPGKIESVTPVVQVQDSKRVEGQKLARYEILKEEIRDGLSWFPVRLVLDKDPQEIEVRYVVVGREPIWVFREEDYARAGGM